MLRYSKTEIKRFSSRTWAKRKFVSRKPLSVFSIRFVTRRPTTNGFRVALSETKGVSRKQFSSSPEQKKLCRNYVKELTLNPSLGKRGSFLPPSLHKRRGKGWWVIQFVYYDTASKRRGYQEKPFLIFSTRIAVNDNANQTKHHKWCWYFISVFSIRQISFVYSKTEYNWFSSRTERSEVRIEKTIVGLLDTFRYSNTDKNNFRIVLSKWSCVAIM